MTVVTYPKQQTSGGELAVSCSFGQSKAHQLLILNSLNALKLIVGF